MEINAQTALSVSGDSRWQRRCAECLLAHGVDVHTVHRGRTAIDLMRKHTYDCIVIDDSLEDMGVLELSLYVPDLAANRPALFVTCPEADRYEKVLNRCNAIRAGERSCVLAALDGYMSKRSGDRNCGAESENVRS